VRPGTIGYLHVFFPIPLGPAGQPPHSRLAAQRAAGARILDLTESNPTHAGLHYPDEIVRAFDDAAMLAYEPAPPERPPRARP